MARKARVSRVSEDSIWGFTKIEGPRTKTPPNSRIPCFHTDPEKVPTPPFRTPPIAGLGFWGGACLEVQGTYSPNSNHLRALKELIRGISTVILGE